jgi:hypothetical protein
LCGAIRFQNSKEKSRLRSTRRVSVDLGCVGPPTQVARCPIFSGPLEVRADWLKGCFHTATHFSDEVRQTLQSTITQVHIEREGKLELCSGGVLGKAYLVTARHCFFEKEKFRENRRLSLPPVFVIIVTGLDSKNNSWIRAGLILEFDPITSSATTDSAFQSRQRDHPETLDFVVFKLPQGGQFPGRAVPMANLQELEVLTHTTQLTLGNVLRCKRNEVNQLEMVFR